MKRARRLVLSCAALASVFVAACGLSTVGTGEGPEGGGQADATADTTVPSEGGGGVDAPPFEAATGDGGVDASPPPDTGASDGPPVDAGPVPCTNTETSCGPPGHCVDCTGAVAGHVCVNGACGCNTPTDCPVASACQSNHTCGSSCGGGGQGGCNGGCCSTGNCVAFDNNHCGAACNPCGGQQPTCGADGSCNGDCGDAGNGTCQNSCCGSGTCAAITPQTCGNPGSTCVDCTSSPAGNQCEMFGGLNFCGCDGPGNQTQCPPNNACYMLQCGVACDGQHPCNGGCCSGGNMPAACLDNCPSGESCKMNFCQ
jgi:hypothetical protein